MFYKEQFIWKMKQKQKQTRGIIFPFVHADILRPSSLAVLTPGWFAYPHHALIAWKVTFTA